MRTKIRYNILFIVSRLFLSSTAPRFSSQSSTICKNNLPPKNTLRCRKYPGYGEQFSPRVKKQRIKDGGETITRNNDGRLERDETN